MYKLTTTAIIIDNPIYNTNTNTIVFAGKRGQMESKGMGG